MVKATLAGCGFGVLHFALAIIAFRIACIYLHFAFICICTCIWMESTVTHQYGGLVDTGWCVIFEVEIGARDGMDGRNVDTRMSFHARHMSRPRAHRCTNNKQDHTKTKTEKTEKKKERKQKKQEAKGASTTFIIVNCKWHAKRHHHHHNHTKTKAEKRKEKKERKKTRSETRMYVHSSSSIAKRHHPHHHAHTHTCVPTSMPVFLGT